MRGTNALGRFDAEYEVKSIRKGISRDLEKPVGQFVDWLVYDSVTSVKDDIYDVGANDGGRAWKPPIRIPVIDAWIIQAQQFQNDRGFYTIDNLTVILNFDDVIRFLPSLDSQPDIHLLDRIVYRGEYFVPNLIFPKGQIGYEYMALRVEGTQVKPEEQINDIYENV